MNNNLDDFKPLLFQNEWVVESFIDTKTKRALLVTNERVIHATPQGFNYIHIDKIHGIKYQSEIIEPWLGYIISGGIIILSLFLIEIHIMFMLAGLMTGGLILLLLKSKSKEEIIITSGEIKINYETSSKSKLFKISKAVASQHSNSIN